ncbi:MAG: hypothetical protein ABL894_08940 [Hyphomicrobium sp.]
MNDLGITPGTQPGSERSWPVRMSGEISSAVRAVLLPVVISLMACAVLAFPDQTIEIYRALAVTGRDDTDLSSKLIEAGSAIAALVVLTLVLRYSAHRLADVATTRGHGSRSANVVFLISGTLFAALPFVACSYGLLRARMGTPPPEVESAAKLALGKVLGDFDGEFLDAAVSYYFSGDKHAHAAAMVLFAASAVLFIAFVLLDFRRLKTGDWRPAPGLHRLCNWLLIITLLGVAWICFFAPVQGWQIFGVLTIGAAFFSCLTLILTQFRIWSERSQLPIIGTLFVAAFVWAHLDLNDNHRVRTIDAASIASRPSILPQASEAFLQWIETRQDKPKFKNAGRKYPVYVVAAQGGGIYAAHHTATFLAGLQDLCPAFSHHLFAISGVSGGSIGASIFTAVASQLSGGVPAPGSSATCLTAPANSLQNFQYAGSVDHVVKNDFLSPIVAAALFPDFAQRFLFMPFPEADRAIALERAFEEAVMLNRRGVGSKAKGSNETANVLSMPYLSHWDAASSLPALLINTTEVGSGRRRLIAPFRFNNPDILMFPVQGDPGTAKGSKPETLSLSTAAVLSARFPWITPAGWFYEHEAAASDQAVSGQREGGTKLRKIRLVDGGYFENSGVATALDLMQEIDAALEQKNLASEVEVYLIVLTTSGYPAQTYYGFGEALDPIRGLLNTRAARSEIVISEAERLLNPEPSAGAGENVAARPGRLRKVRLKDMGYPLPLGWRLSDLTRMLIFAQNGIPSECDPDKRHQQKNPKRFDADCVADLVRRELQ